MPEEVLDKPQSEEEVDDLEQKMEYAKKMRTLVNSDGWPILAGYIQGGKKAALKTLLADTDPKNILHHQQAYNTLDAIEKFVMNVVNAGEAARKQLYPEERRQSKG